MPMSVSIHTKDCQLSSMIKLLMLISFLASESSASNSFCSVRCCPIPFHVQYDSPSSVCSQYAHEASYMTHIHQFSSHSGLKSSVRVLNSASTSSEVVLYCMASFLA
jgi:hypothetical protein